MISKRHIAKRHLALLMRKLSPCILFRGMTWDDGMFIGWDDQAYMLYGDEN